MSSMLVAVAFDRASRTLLDRAIGFAMQFGSDVTLLHVDGDDDRVECSKALRRIAHQIEQDYGLRCQSANVQGDPVDGIARVAEKTAADVVSLATHGRFGTARAQGGSVAERVARISPRPVLTILEAVPDHFDALDGLRIRPILPNVHTILLPIDPHSVIDSAIEIGDRFAMEMRAELRFLHVEGRSAAASNARIGVDDGGIGGQLRKRVLPHLHDVTGASFEVCAGTATESILGQDADLIVMGLAGRSRSRRGVAERIVREACCPVLTTH